MIDRPFHCPTFVESFIATCNLWPRGRAWPVSDGSTPSRFLAWIASVIGVPLTWPTGFVQAGYSAALAVVRNHAETRLCALRLEFWCASQSETTEQWMIEYGLPDPCDPFPDLCTKVAAIGGTRCEYYAEIAARSGWVITCDTIVNDCGAGVGCFEAGCGVVGPNAFGSILQITVYLPISPAYVAISEAQPYAGNMEVGEGLNCDPDITSLKCALDRVVHAHIVIDYVLIFDEDLIIF